MVAHHRSMAFQRNDLPQIGLYDEISCDSLPEGWVVVNEINEDGIVEYFLNLKANETFHTREELIRYVAYAQASQLQNNYVPIAPAPAPVPGMGQPQPMILPPTVRCGRCGGVGHLVHQCQLAGPNVKAMHALYQSVAYRKGKGNQRSTYQCSRCGQYGHNRRSCRRPWSRPPPTQNRSAGETPNPTETQTPTLWNLV